MVERPVSWQPWVQSNVFLKGLFSTHKEVESGLLGEGGMVLLSVSSLATLICTCWENTDNHQFHWASTLSPVFLSFWKCRIMRVLFVVPQSVLISLLSLGQATDIFHIDVLLNWECDLPEVSMLMSSWLKQAWRKQTCLSMLY